MKINEVMQPSNKALLEQFAQDTSTGLKAEQMLEIYREANSEKLEVITEDQLWEICMGSDK